MEILDLIEELEEMADKAVPLPFTGKCMFSKDEFLEILQEIRLKLPDDLKQAKWIKDERERILHEAKYEASEILKNAENKVAAMVDEHDVTKKALEKSNNLLNDANGKAKEINTAAFEYADEVLEEVEVNMLSYIKKISSFVDEIRKNRQQLRGE